MTDSKSQLDTRGLICPMPLMLLKKAVADLPEGAMIEVVVTDPHAELDVEIWCDRFGHSLTAIDSHAIEGEMLFQVIKSVTE